jgi:ATP-binding cassette subfamily B protein
VLVGENGAGRTALVKLLARPYDPDEGRILRDGHDHREWHPFALRSDIGVILRDSVRGHPTAAKDIAAGTHERLLTAGGRNAERFELQAAAYR